LSTILPAPPVPAGEPEWLGAARRRAAEAMAGTSWPTVDQEDWRYSPIGTVDPAAYALRTDGTGVPGGVAAVLEAVGAHGARVTLVDGQLAEQWCDPVLAAAGVQVGRLAELGPAAEGAADGVAIDGDAFALAAAAHAPEPLLVRIPRGVVVEQPIVVVQWAGADGALSYSHVIVEVGADAQADVVVVEASDDVEALHVGLIEGRVDGAGRLRMVDVQQLGRRVRRIATHRTSVGAQGSLDSMQIALGGSYARTRSDCHLVGRGASGDLLALYFGSDDQVLDFRTFQHHEARDTTSNLLFKGAVADRARSIYTGLIHVHPEAAGTNAFQTNRNLKLSEDAWADSVPNLEIENNDVRCSHASTVGPIDEDQRFYLESRGVRPEAADRLIVAGFFEEVLKKVTVPALRESLRADLGGRVAAVDLEVVA
jgi:Fe-S cluster assembly protein SufD